MDPLSAVLAFTGLGASLITLVDAISEVSTKLLELRRKFKDAPRSILQLNDDLQKLRALLVIIQARFSRDEAADYPPALRFICENSIMQLKKELRELHMIVNRSSAKSTLTVGVGFKAKVQHVLAESTIQEFRGRIGTHIMYLGMMHTPLITYKIDHLNQNTRQILDETKGLFRLMSSQMRLFRSISHQQQSPPSLASEEYIGDQNSNRRLGFVKRHATEKKCDFNSGQRGITKRLKLAFLAPPWLSRTALLATIDQLSQSFLMGMGPRVTLQPITVNHSPKLLEALHRLDLLQLKQLFETNRARPNDMVMDIRMNEPVTLFEALLGTFVGFSPCSNVLSKHEELLSFLIDQGAPGSAKAVTIFFLKMSSYWANDRPDMLLQSAHRYLQTLLDHDAISLDAFSISCKSLFGLDFAIYHRYGLYKGNINESLITALMEGPLSFEELRYCLFHQSQSWTSEDLSGRGLWYVAVLAHADRSFREALLAYAHSFRSTISTNEQSSPDSVLKSILDIEGIAHEVEASKGTPAMLAPFLRTNIQLVDNLGSAEDQVQDDDGFDPLAETLESSRALENRSDAPQILLKNKLLSPCRLYGPRSVFFGKSYVLWALYNNSIEILEELLDNGPPVDFTIKDMFKTTREHFQSIMNYTWLTLAVELGRSECVGLILNQVGNQEQAVNHRDGAGRSALQIAQSSNRASHPRHSVLHGLHWIEDQERTIISAAEDEATLLIVQSAGSTDAIAARDMGNSDVDVDDIDVGSADLPSGPVSYLLTLLHQAELLKARVIDIIVELLPSSPMGFSSDEIYMHCKRSTSWTNRQEIAQALKRARLAKISEITYPEALLGCISYVLMIGVITVYDLIALIFTLRDLNRPLWPSLVVIGMVLLLSIWPAGRLVQG